MLLFIYINYNKFMIKKKRAKKNKWIQSAIASIPEKNKGVCSGSKLGSPSCPAGSKRYVMAKTLKKIGKNK